MATAKKPAAKKAAAKRPAAKKSAAKKAPAKKVAAKKAPAKKTAAKRPAAKKVAAKKVAAKKVAAKKVAAKKAPAKKAAAKKAPAKRAPAKKAVAKKAAAKKPAAKKRPAAKKAAKKPAAKKVAPVLKKGAQPTVDKKPSQQSPSAAKIAAAAQLNFFQMPNQRPMAHKPAKPSSMSLDKTRYSDDELKEFQILINRKLEKAREEYKILKETLNRNNDEGTDATSGGNTKVLEDGAETAEKENLSQLAARQQKYITNLENALVRIKNGTYGICSVTGKLISKERLIAVPHTTQSIEAKLMQQD